VLDLFWLIPLVPLVGVLINGLFGRRFLNERLIGVIACCAIFISLLIAVGAVWELAQLAPDLRHHEIVLFDWIPGGLVKLGPDSVAGDSAMFNIEFGFLLDPLSAVMILVVTGVGFLIHV